MLIENWRMTYEEFENLPCKAPCSLYGVLLENKLIEDPFYGLNELEITQLSEKGCSFESEFIADEDILKKQYIELKFFGLDTICSVQVNGYILGNVKNMHREYIFDLKNVIVKGINKIKLDFFSPIKYFEKMNKKHPLYSNRENTRGSAHLRKALYMSGWDWGPRLPDMGIFRPVELEAYDEDKIENIYVKQDHENGQVVLDISVETRHDSSEGDIFVCIDNKEIKLNEDKNGSVVIENPKLWWIRGYGEQPLYDITATIKKDGNVIDIKSQKIGLRTLTVSRNPDKKGSEFCFVINGVKIFAMGANYIPQDNLLSRINPERTETLIKAAIDANFNCLRVWGGGYYPENEFYDICDKYGILVWQDFMLACVEVWLNSEMKKEFIAEAIDNVKRLRHHASLGMLCGNNEIEVYHYNWGFEKSQLLREDYIELFERIFPDVCDKFAPEIFYWPASPSSGGGFINPNDETVGDVHFWDVWFGGLPFSEYRNHNFRFCSEYGFQSYPSIKTIRSFCEEEDMNCFSRVMENHQKCISGNQKIFTYLSESYLYPLNFETLVYASQLLQADAIKYAVEHFRRNRGYCMGSLYWQFNDCWPVASWSSVDSFGRYKALHYAAKKFYAPVSMGLFLDDNELVINISNETMENFEGEIRVCHSDTQFNIIESYTKTTFVESLKSNDVFSVHLNCSNKYKEFVSVELFDKDGNFIVRQTELFVAPKHFEWEKPEIRVEITNSDNMIELCVESNTFTKGVYIDFEEYDCVLSDNFFDITDRKPYKVTTKTNCSVEDLKKSLKLMSVYDIGRCR